MTALILVHDNINIGQSRSTVRFTFFSDMKRQPACGLHTINDKEEPFPWTTTRRPRPPPPPPHLLLVYDIRWSQTKIRRSTLS